MKKLVSVLLLLSLLLTAAAAAADEGQAAVDAFSAKAGLYVRLGMQKTADYDVNNSRMVFIGNAKMGSELVVLIRLSDTEVAYWPLALNEDNLVLAKTLFTEDAPYCLLGVYRDGKMQNASIYVQGDSTFPYEKFMTKVNGILDTYLTGGAGTGDPLLSAFPGLKWTMSKKDVTSTYGEGRFMSNQEQSAICYQKIDGDSLLFLFMFTGGRLSQVRVSNIPEGKIEGYRDRYTALYGEPIRCQQMSILMGKPVQSSAGDSWAWKNGDTLVGLNGTNIFFVPAK